MEAGGDRPLLGRGAGVPRGQKGTDTTTTSPSARAWSHVGVSPWKLLRVLYLFRVFSYWRASAGLLWLWLCVETRLFLNIEKERTGPAFFPSSGRHCLPWKNCQDLTGFQRTPCSARLGAGHACGSRLRVSELWGPCSWDVEQMALSPPQALAGPPARQLLWRPPRLPTRSLGCQVPGAGEPQSPRPWRLV